MPDTEPPPESLAEIGRYAKFSHAQERGLVAAALEVPYWVIRQGREFVLFVEPPEQERVRAELDKFEREVAEHRARLDVPEVVLPKLDTMPLFLAACVMAMFWAAQNFVPESWLNRGDSSNRAIFAGEWWRTITALTLHGDLGHFLANLAFGLLFSGFLVQRLGGGITWLAVLLTGAVGNALNAWFYRSEPHDTIGASTAVFGALGLLVTWEILYRWRSPGRRGWWQLVVPFGGGLALLAFFGSGDEEANRVDHMAHFWGFGVGLALGVVAALAPRSAAAQRVAGVLALALPLAAWALALR